MNYSKKQIKTEDGSTTYRMEDLKENYHSLNGAITESHFVYITEGFNFWTQKNKDRECNILELGYGTGLMTYMSFLEADRMNRFINYTSLEPYPLTIEEVNLLNYDQFFENSKDLMTFNKFSTISWEETHKVSPHFRITKKKICFEDYKSQKFFDLIYYDAFGAHVQPELWEPELMKKCYSLLNPGGAWVSYCSKGSVRRGLKEVGFSVYRLPGPPGKREMLRAVKK